jgi:hypothetical protein
LLNRINKQFNLMQLFFYIIIIFFGKPGLADGTSRAESINIFGWDGGRKAPVQYLRGAGRPHRRL